MYCEMDRIRRDRERLVEAGCALVSGGVADGGVVGGGGVVVVLWLVLLWLVVL